MDVQRPSMASAVGSGGGREKGDDEECDQGRRRASAHEAPALGDLGDELARTTASSALVGETPGNAECVLVVNGHVSQAQNPEFFEPKTCRFTRTRKPRFSSRFHCESRVRTSTSPVCTHSNTYYLGILYMCGCG